ncbi:MAG: VWA domain-containing protein, partial [Chloroflexi bacterium]|nr:VWA domain-containing protein [Chloroflexota bacterium]
IQKANRKILFIDELNRVPERTQNTLIEVLEERMTTIAGFDINIPVDTIVVATQNPEEFAGASRLSETLSDRFERVRIDYPTPEQEAAILERYARKFKNIGFDHELLTEVARISQSVRSGLTGSEADGLIAEIARRLRKHPDVTGGPSVRGTIAFKEVLQGFAELKDRLKLNSIDKTAQATLPSRISTKEKHSASAIVNDIIRGVLYGSWSPQGKIEASLADNIELSTENNAPPDSLDFPQDWEDPGEKEELVVIPDEEKFQGQNKLKRRTNERDKQKLEEALSAALQLNPPVSDKELADMMVRFIDAKDKQFEEEKELSFEDMYVYLRLNDEQTHTTSPKRDWSEFRVLVNYLQQRQLVETAGRSFTLTGQALDMISARLMPRTWKGLKLNDMLDYGKVQLSERTHDVRRYAIGDVFRDISIRRTLKEIVKRRKKLSDVQRRELRVFLREHHKSYCDIMLCIDSSGSMGFGQKMVYARLLAAEIAKTALANGDKVGVVTFDDFGRAALPLTAKREEIFDYIARINSMGNTNIGDGIECAAELLLNERSGNQKHIILITDGEPTAISQNAFSRLEPRKETALVEYSILETRKASSRRMAVSVINITAGEETSRDFIEDIARAGKGQVLTVSTAENIRLLIK